MRIETRQVWKRGIRWIVRDGDRTVAKGWFRDGRVWADFGELTDDVLLELADAGLAPFVADGPAEEEE